MHKTCPYCDTQHLSKYIGMDGDRICSECARREIIGVLNDMTEDETKKLRRQIEDCLRKNPAALQDVASLLILNGVLALGV